MNLTATTVFFALLGAAPQPLLHAQPDGPPPTADRQAKRGIMVHAVIRRDGAEIFAPALLLQAGTRAAAVSELDGERHEFILTARRDASSGAYLLRTRYLVDGHEVLAPAFLLQRGATAESASTVGEHLWTVGLQLH